jgi:uncharacterized caspase-like protein
LVFREKQAIVVGVSSPRDRRLALRFASKDAVDVVHALCDPAIGRFRSDPDHLHLLIDRQASRAAIEAAVRKVGIRSASDDLTVIFLSVHGIEEQVSGKRYFSTYDTDISDLAGTAFDMTSFIPFLEAQIAGRIVLVTDVCLGSAVPFATRKGLMVQRQSTAARTIVISSSSPNEDAYESANYQNSVFTFYFLRALRQLGDYGDLNAIFMQVLHFVPAAVWNETRQWQHPTMYPAYVPARIVLRATTKE